MDYTQSDQFTTHTPTGQRLHQEDGPIPTAMSAKDFNSVIWSLMEVVKAGGRSGVQFDASSPTSYQQLLLALQSLISTASGDRPGRVNVFMQPTAPTGWLPMKGLLLSRTTYPALWAHVQTVGAVTEAAWTAGLWGWFSAGDGSTTFRIPDLRAMSLRGLDDGRGIDASRVIGSYQADQILAHGHAVTDPGHLHTVFDPTHNHGLNDPGHRHTWGANEVGQDPATGNGYPSSDGSNSLGHLSYTSSVGTGVSINAAATGLGIYAALSGITVGNSSGGTETRVANVALPFYLKY